MSTAKFGLESKLIAADNKTKLRIYANEGKNGINLGATYKAPGMKATTGCQETVETQAEAKARFDALVADAQTQGWLPRQGSTGVIGRRSTFNAIPPAPGAADVVNPPAEKVVGGDVVDKDGFVVDRSESPELVPAVANGGGKKGKK